MAKDKKKNPPVEAPVVENKEEKAPTAKVDKVDAEIVNPGTKKGLSQEAKVNYLTEMRMRKQELMEEENPPMELVNGYDMIRDAIIIDIACGEIACGSSATGHILIANEQNYKALQLAATCRGVKMPEFKALPRPTKTQLEAVGIAEVGEIRALPMKDIKPSKEAIEKKKKENKLNEDAASGKKEYMNDHTKIETDEQLKEALAFQLVNTKIISPLDRLITTAQFYRSYLESRAEKSDNAEAELAKIHEFTLADLLQDISTMVPPSFTAEGFGQLLCKRVSNVQNVIPAFELLKRCGKNRKTGIFRFSDEEIAALVRVLVVWKASAQIASLSKDLAVLSKDAKKNAEAIAKTNAAIADEQALMSLVTEPGFELADNFIAAYKDKDHELHHQADEAAKSIIETHYKNLELTELEVDSLLLNIQQHIGIDLNLFNSTIGRREEYDEKNLISFEPAKKTEEKTEEEPKNS